MLKNTEAIPRGMLAAALGYAAANLPVFPCAPCAKIPATRNGFHDATTNPETVKRFWRIADRNIGIPTGPVSGFWILDIDGADGEANLCVLQSKHGPLPPTRQVNTGAGRHLWFAYTGPIQSSAGRIAAGIDVRGDGAYAIVPPSVHPSGRSYSWSADSPEDMAAAPPWLVELARRRPAPISERALANLRARHSGAPGAYGQAALDRESADLAATLPGGRNHALNRAAFRLFQLVAGGELKRDQVVERLIDACHRNSLIKDDGEHSVIKTIHSGAGAGLKFPRARNGGAS
jgi:hypothetical protein